MSTSKDFKRYTVTAALPYANGYKHIGHLAGVYLPSDIYVRYLRSCKKDVLFVCGSDEHGAAITLQAIKEKKTPQEIVDFYHGILEKDLRTMGISFDIYHRTSAELHHQTAADFFETMEHKHLLEKKEEEQYFDIEAHIFLADRYIQGVCPYCNHGEAYGDQCEKCGTALSPLQLLNPHSTITKTKPILKKTTHYYLPLQEYEDFIRSWMIKNEQKGWKSNVVGQSLSWINNGLQPRAITRDLTWGVKVKVDNQDKVLYVWFDAPIGYISATKQWALNHSKNWEPYWKYPDTKLVHFIGKDNIVFHCIIFPIMLHLNGYILPDQVPANEFMNLEGDKMSTSKNWKLDIHDYIVDFIGEEDTNRNAKMVDALRYYLTQIMPEAKDSEFTWKKFQDANNSELVAIWGNFVNRVWILTHKLCKSRIPPLHKELLDEKDTTFIHFLQEQPTLIGQNIATYKFREALTQTIEVARKANKYLQDKEPWILQKKIDEQPQNQRLIDNSLHLCLQATANMAILIDPFLPFTARKMCRMMKVVDDILHWEHAGRTDLLKAGYTLPEPELLFDIIADEAIQKQLEKLQANHLNVASEKWQDVLVSQTPTPRLSKKAEVDFSTFELLDLRVGEIIEASRVMDTEKLMCLLVDIGFEKRTIVSGIAHQFSPQDLVGKKVIVVANLKAKKMKSVESHGMLLLSEDEDGKLSFLAPTQEANNGDICR